jgi:lipopolysaccharide/colanic/teichoic acid biosynthesis glycosyltransferase
MLKRAFDLLFSIFGLIVLLPVGILISVIIYLDDNKSAIFKQKRIGLNQQSFILYKFRSMSINKDSSNGSFEAGNKSRVTNFGKILRKTKLDEIPQLINVLMGDMSFVGPRPEVEKWVLAYPEQWAFVLTVKPGITDNAAILFRNEEELLAGAINPELYYKEIILPRKLNIYTEYVNNHSLMGDIQIIIMTIFTILRK